MKHLLNSIESGGIDVSNVNVDIRQLLTEARDLKHARSTEGFYEALEKILSELRNSEHAYPFLKPVRRSEAPNYDLVIKHPMDLGTMTKKVKTHVYKTQREFVDDLNLIWDNCLKYNTDPAHPLRRSTVFMRKKADQAVERILGNADRIPNLILPTSNGISSQQPTGRVGGVTGKDRRLSHDHSLKSKFKTANGRAPKLPNGMIYPRSAGHTPTLNGAQRGDGRLSASLAKSKQNRAARSPESFPDTPAIIRTPQNMQQCWDLDHDMQKYLDSAGAGPSKPSPFSNTRVGFLPDDGSNNLRRKFHTILHDEESPQSFLAREYQSNLTFDKGLDPDSSSSNRPLKRLKTSFDSPASRAAIARDSQYVGMWWGSVWSDALAPGGIPRLILPEDDSGSAVFGRKTLKRKRSDKISIRPSTSTGMKGIMYKNIDTLRHIRRTHSALLASIPSSSAGSDPPERFPPAPRMPEAPPAAPPDVPGPIPLEDGAQLAGHMLKRNCAQLLEHSGFEGSGKVPLGVLTDIGAEFMMNMGRTLKFLSEQHSDTMSSEEIILHTLFESGIARVQDLESYIRDDVERYGGRLAELDRKLDVAYNELLESEPILEDDDGLFAEDGDALMTGDFSAALGEDFFGFRELGLDKEFGLSSMSIPPRLFHGHGKRKDPRAQEGANKEPPLRFPPPQPFVPLTSNKLGKQIGLLRPFYQTKFEKVRDSVPSHKSTQPAPPLPPSTGQLLLGPEPHSSMLSIDDPSAPVLELPDEAPNQLKSKMGPLGQISLSSSPTSKKKPKASSSNAPPPSNTITNVIPVHSPVKNEPPPSTPAFTTFQLENRPVPASSGLLPNGNLPASIDVNGIAKANTSTVPHPPHPPSTSKKKKTKKDSNLPPPPPQPPNPNPPAPFPPQPSLMVS
ncbi:uncharacterized protein EI90DRAFT_3029785 [Cantharellus anzutake]|uniref:uncharacterized protein n=1 Tax=Cantharellus anzutake TaxID=1750568 RepID=UPI001906AF08|nr:uncharacterized protein EI90DRAFT_3029785 [Cantharellus anzutake]KAF8342661.1 hypothetical protein EI90DRAFT_3029785 [Cantharellus anzutake]